MKIALVSPYDHGTPGGVRQHVVNLDKQLRALGHETLVLAPITVGADVAGNVKPVSHWIQTLNISASQARVSLDPLGAIRIRSALRHGRLDIVHLHEPLIPVACLTALLLGGAPMIGTIHGYRDTSPLYAVGRPLLGRWIGRLSARTAVSTDARAWAQRYFPGEYELISDGVDVAAFACESTEPSDPTVLFVGRLDERKGFPYLLEAFVEVRAHVPRARLVVAGAYTPDQHAAAQWSVRDRGVAGVSFVGRVSDEELPALYRRATVFCAPSTGYEALGIVLLEAMAAGRAIVTTNIEGYRTVVRHDIEALVVPPRDAGALAAALIALLTDPMRRRRLVQGGRERVRLYDWSVLARRYVALYERVRERTRT